MIARLEAQLRHNPWLWQMLRRFDEILLPDCWLVAGCLAQTVWNLAGGRPAGFGVKDADLVYVGAADLSAAAEAEHEKRLRARFGDLPVTLDVKNEARVPLWCERVFGTPIPAYRSTADAIASFPTTATAVGVRRVNGAFECCAPFGLDDLFALRVRPNKRQITPAIYATKLARWRPLWPHVTFLAWDEAG